MKPVVRIISVIAVSLVFCQMIFIPINKGNLKFHSDLNMRLHEVLESHTDYDLLFLGASKVYRNINPGIIDSICHVSSYDAGYDGGKLHELEMYMEAYLQNHPPPKVIVLNLDWFSFTTTQCYWNYPQFYPFLDNRSLYGKLRSNIGLKMDLMKFLPFLRITALDDYTKINGVKWARGTATDLDKGDIEYKGYLSNTDLSLNPNAINVGIDYGPEEITDISIRCLNQIIDTCKKNHTKLIVIFPPEYDFKIHRQVTNADSISGVILKTVKDNKLDYFRFDSLSFCRNPAIFKNCGHLNKRGSVIYSTILAEELRTSIQDAIKGDSR